MKRNLLLFLAFLTTLVYAQNTVIVYQFQVIQLSKQVITKAGLDEMIVKKTATSEGSIGIFYSASTMELLAQFPIVTVKLGIGEKEEKSKTLSRPWLTTILGQKAVVFVGQEELVLQTGFRRGQGIRLEVTPISITKEGILSKLSLVDPYGPATYDNELYIDLKDFKPIALISSKSDNDFEYFVIYAKATVADKSPETNVYGIGSLDELAMIFTQDEFFEKVNTLYALILTDFSSYDAELGTSIWINDTHIQMHVTFNPLTFVASLEGLVDKLGLRAGARFHYCNIILIDFGVSDYVKLSEILTAFAEFYPFRIDILQLKFVSPSWRIGLLIDYKSFSLSLGTFNEGKFGMWADTTFKVSPGISAIAGVRYNSNKFVLYGGLHLSF